MNENILMAILQFDPECKIPLMGKLYRVRPIRVISNVMLVSAFFLNFLTFFHNALNTISDFVLWVLTVSIWIVFTAYLSTQLQTHDETKEVYNTVTDIDAQMNTSLSHQKDRILYLIAGMSPVQAVITTVYIVARGFRPYDLPIFAFTPIANKIVEVTVLKYLIAKRLRYLRSAEEYTTRVEDTIFITRQLLECNTTINNTYSLLAASYTIFTCQLTIQLLYSIWAVYGAGLDFYFEPMSHPILVSGVSCSFFTVAGLLAVTSSLVVDEVQEVSLELDITYSARDCTDLQKELIYLFLMELHQTPVEMSAVGLYNIGRSSVSTACAVLTSFLLVLIQYT